MRRLKGEGILNNSTFFGEGGGVNYRVTRIDWLFDEMK